MSSGRVRPARGPKSAGSYRRDISPLGRAKTSPVNWLPFCFGRARGASLPARVVLSGRRLKPLAVDGASSGPGAKLRDLPSAKAAQHFIQGRSSGAEALAQSCFPIFVSARRLQINAAEPGCLLGSKLQSLDQLHRHLSISDTRVPSEDISRGRLVMNKWMQAASLYMRYCDRHCASCRLRGCAHK